MSSKDVAEQHVFEPLPQQKSFIESTEDQVLLSGSFGAGKSRVGCEKGYLLNQHYPGNRGLIVRKHFSDVKASTIEQTFLKEVVPKSQIVSHNKSEHKVEHLTDSVGPDGEPVKSEVHYHGLDSGASTSDDDLPRKIGSTSWGWIFVDEATEVSRGEWNQLQGRLRYDGTMVDGQYFPVPMRQIFGATNPASPQHFLHEIFIDEARGDHYSMSVKDNPHVPQDYKDRLERELSGMYYERYVLGKWVGAEGMIYDEFDLETHHLGPKELPGNCTDEDCEVEDCNGWHIERETTFDDGKAFWAHPPPNYRVFRSVDYGYRNPMVVQWWAQSPDDEIVMFREFYKSEELVADVAERIKDYTDDEWTLERTVSDHDAENSAQLHRAGVQTQNAKKSVQRGIQAVKTRLSTDDRGRPGMYIMRGARVHPPDTRLSMNDNPTRTVEEFPSYVWKDRSQKEKPRKEDDHGLDALRYLIATIDEGNHITLDEMERWSELVNSGF
jgi:phage terminase large subunit